MQWISQIEQKFIIVIVVFWKIEVYSTLDDEKYAHIDPVFKNPAFFGSFFFQVAKCSRSIFMVWNNKYCQWIAICIVPGVGQAHFLCVSVTATCFTLRVTRCYFLQVVAVFCQVWREIVFKMHLSTVCPFLRYFGIVEQKQYYKERYTPHHIPVVGIFDD